MTAYLSPKAKNALEKIPEDLPVVETDLTEAEKAIVAAGRAEYKAHPETFISLSV